LQVAENYKEYLGDHTCELLKKVLTEELTGGSARQKLGFEEFSLIKDFLI